jgi:hypothetical protein
MAGEATREAGLLPVILSIGALAAIAVAAIVRPALVIEVNWADFLVITVLIGGWAAWMTGRAIAGTWRPYWHVVAYMVPFAVFVRWVHFALFHGTFTSVPYFLVDFAVVLALASLGYRVVRAKQMTTQYRWLFDKSGPFGWRRQA